MRPEKEFGIMDETVKWLRDLGPLGGILAMIWWFLSRSGKFLAPKVSSLLVTHQEMMSTLGEQAVRQSDHAEQQIAQTDTQIKQTEQQIAQADTHTALLSVIVDTTKQHGEKLDAIHQHVMPEE